MESLLVAHKKLERQGGLDQTINDVQATIDLLKSAREGIANGNMSFACYNLPTDQTQEDCDPSITLAKLKNPMKQSFDKLNQDVKELHAALTNYSKTLDKVCIMSRRLWR